MNILSSPCLLTCDEFIGNFPKNKIFKILTNIALKFIGNLINIIFDTNDTIENNIQNNFVESSEILEIKEVIEFLNSNSKRGITTFAND